MRVKLLQVGPCASTVLGRCGPFAAGTHGIETLGIIRQDGFKAEVTLPMSEVVVDVTEALASVETEGAQHDVPGIGTVAAIILAIDVEVMQVFVAPVKDDLDHGMELSQGVVASDQESPPDERADASQDDAQLIDVRVCSVLVHEQSVRRNPLCCKRSPRYLAVPYKFKIACSEWPNDMTMVILRQDSHENEEWAENC